MLADVLGVALIRNGLYRRIEARAPWALQVPEVERATFYLIVRGEAELVVDSVVIALSAGDVALVPHGSPHTLRDAPDSAPVHVCGRGTPDGPGPRRIGGDGALTSIVAGFYERGSGRPPPLLEAMPAVIVLAATDPAYHRGVAATVQLIVSESTSCLPASSLVMQRLADVLLVQLLRARASHRDCPSQGLRALDDPAVHRALGLLHSQLAAPWTVASLASRVGMSRSAFAARFTELVGEPPLQYLVRWRMARAGELLRDTGDDIASVARTVGYRSVPSFTRAFKRWQGASPGAFRRQVKGEVRSPRPPTAARTG
ncbi:MAG: AraC family transcriptional regulator [Myxococcota bacterium]